MNLFVSTVWAQDGGVSSETSGGLGEFFSAFFSSLPLWIAAILIFFFSFFLAGLLKRLVINRIVKKSKYEVHKELLLLAGRAVYFGMLVLGIAISFEIVNINLWALIGAMGIGLGFAFKDLLGNFIAGVVILTQKRFTIGDLVQVNDVFGHVEDIDTRISVVRTFDGTHMVIPNSEMLNSIVQVYTAEESRRRIFRVPVHYKTPLDRAIPFIKETVKKNTSVLIEPDVQVLAIEFGESSINLEVRYWIQSRDRAWPVIESEIIQMVQAELRRVGIVIPFPIRTLALDPFDQNLLKAAKLQ
ncbi:MAG TPA: mechanosensitive ion channel family protein [Candidatus Gracilibacteria bacterium]